MGPIIELGLLLVGFHPCWLNIKRLPFYRYTVDVPPIPKSHACISISRVLQASLDLLEELDPRDLL